jgi:hypothetical protein
MLYIHTDGRKHSSTFPNAGLADPKISSISPCRKLAPHGELMLVFISITALVALARQHCPLFPFLAVNLSGLSVRLFQDVWYLLFKGRSKRWLCKNTMRAQFMRLGSSSNSHSITWVVSVFRLFSFHAAVCMVSSE